MRNRTFFNYLLAGFAAFAIDLVTPLGSGVWSLFIILLILYVKFVGSYKVFHLSFVYLVLLVCGYILSPPGFIENFAVINRSASLIIMLLIAYLARREGEVRKINSEILDRISDSVVALDKKWNITYLSSALQKMLKHNLNPIGKNMWEVFPELKGTIVEAKYRESLHTLKPLSFKSKLFSEREYEINTYPSLEGLTVYSRDITDLADKEKQLQKLIEQKDMLIKEVHHRVKNNFQLVSSLIRLSSLESNTNNAGGILKDIDARVKTLALIHEKLYKSSNENQIDLKSYLEELFDQFAAAVNHSSKNIEHEVVVEDVDVNIDSAISIGLIVNELYSNSLKHGFKERSKGKIHLRICLFTGDRCRLELKYRDNGLGFTADEPLITPGSMGMAIIKSYVEQHDGTIKSYNNGGGAEYIITLNIN